MDSESVNMVVEKVIPAREVFREWVNLFRQEIDLTAKEAELAAAILKTREMMVSRFGSAEGMLVGRIRLYIADSMDISPANLTFLLSKLRKKGFLVGNDVALGYVPELKRDSSSFDVLFHFDLRGDEKGV